MTLEELMVRESIRHTLATYNRGGDGADYGLLASAFVNARIPSSHRTPMQTPSAIDMFPSEGCAAVIGGSGGLGGSISDTLKAIVMGVGRSTGRSICMALATDATARGESVSLVAVATGHHRIVPPSMV